MADSYLGCVRLFLCAVWVGVFVCCVCVRSGDLQLNFLCSVHLDVGE